MNRRTLNLRALPVPHPMTRADRVPAQRYYDSEFYAAENELLWPRVWQMACFLAEIPHPGDYITYNILDKAVVVVRGDDGSVRAFHNACRHRGVELVRGRGNLRSGFICPFHGWCYGLDGVNTFVYQPDLFEESNRRPEDLNLVPCRVETWGGSAFINFDPNARPLHDCLKTAARYCDPMKVEGLWPEWWLSCRLPTNWKLAMDAFMEGYHVMQTHPQLFPSGASRQVYRDVSESVASMERLSAQLAVGHVKKVDPRMFVDQQLHMMRSVSVGMAGLIHEKDVRIAEGLRNIELPDDFGGAIAGWTRALHDAILTWNSNQGIDMPDLHAVDAQGLTGITFCFPNYFLLPYLSSGAAYRVRPLGPEECLFEIWSLTRYPPGEAPPAPLEPEPMLADDPRWSLIPSQDFSNLPSQQRGLHADGFEYMRLSDRIEGMIGNYQRLIDGYLAGLPHEHLVAAMQQVCGHTECESRDIGF
ncbi:MAG: (2Fe-2S)-binding protein [Acidimicrobiales bacterium]|jgi:phenylpropionate dioxygenase-like ring-hydroxylating dioxygenase large terminal subunit|nr:(2Fe-2S)-binding protein [Acidimicrobiales bacterium]